MDIYEMEMDNQTVSQLIDFLIDYTTKLDNYYDIEEVVHMIDFLEEERERAKAIINGEYRRWIEWQHELPDFIRYLVTQGYDEAELKEIAKHYSIIAGQEIEEVIDNE